MPVTHNVQIHVSLTHASLITYTCTSYVHMHVHGQIHTAYTHMWFEFSLSAIHHRLTFSLWCSETKRTCQCWRTKGSSGQTSKRHIYLLNIVLCPGASLVIWGFQMENWLSQEPTNSPPLLTYNMAWCPPQEFPSLRVSNQRSSYSTCPNGNDWWMELLTVHIWRLWTDPEGKPLWRVTWLVQPEVWVAPEYCWSCICSVPLAGSVGRISGGAVGDNV